MRRHCHATASRVSTTSRSSLPPRTRIAGTRRRRGRRTAARTSSRRSRPAIGHHQGWHDESWKLRMMSRSASSLSTGAMTAVSPGEHVPARGVLDRGELVHVSSQRPTRDRQDRSNSSPTVKLLIENDVALSHRSGRVSHVRAASDRRRSARSRHPARSNWLIGPYSGSDSQSQSRPYATSGTGRRERAVRARLRRRRATMQQERESQRAQQPDRDSDRGENQ